MKKHHPSTPLDDPEAGDALLADRAAELADRLRRGAAIDPTDFDSGDSRLADELRRLMPTIRKMTDLAGPPTTVAGPSSLGDFRIIREIARGGMGVVYEAVQESLGRRVALKVLLNAAALDPRHVRRFHIEAQAAASLHHPQIVPVFAIGSEGGMPFYAMQFIEGRDLSRVIDGLRGGSATGDTEADPYRPVASAPLPGRGPAFANAAVRLIRQAAEALEYAHAHDVLHRDIKPSNLLIDDAGRLWITDFGLARIRVDLELTQTGDALGTPRYMSPEQALGRRALLDGRTDIYSLGATLYELLTLRPAFPGHDRLDLLRRLAEEEPVSPRQIDPTIPVDLETIVLKAMAKDPSQRYATAADLAADLRRFLDDRPILARRPSLAVRVAKWSRRHRSLVAGLAACAGLIAVILAVGAWRSTVMHREHEAALRAEIDRANHHHQEAERQRCLVDRHYHAAQLRLARQAIDSRQFEVAQNLLDEVVPHRDGGDPGAFAWRSPPQAGPARARPPP